MPAPLISRRALAAGLAVLPAALDTTDRAIAAPGDGDGLSHSAAAIHQEALFKASRARVYEVLTGAKEFDAVTRLSDAVTLITAPHAKATSIDHEVGGAFTLFGGYVTGRHLEMVRNERLVQAWRAGSWGAGDYSIVRFVLLAQGVECKLVFDHRGFPDSQGASLAYGWGVHYWEPMAKFLAQG
jgi:activator of HSP90 ATPase